MNRQQRIRKTLIHQRCVVLLASTLSCAATAALAETQRNPYFGDPTQKTQSAVGAVDGLPSNKDPLVHTQSPTLGIIDFDAIDRLMRQESSKPSVIAQVADQSRTRSSPRSLLLPRRLPLVRPESSSTGEASNAKRTQPNQVRRLAPIRQRNTETDSLALGPPSIPDAVQLSPAEFAGISPAFNMSTASSVPPVTGGPVAIATQGNRLAPASLAGFQSRPTDQRDDSVEPRSPIKRLFDKIPNLW